MLTPFIRSLAMFVAAAFVVSLLGACSGETAALDGFMPHGMCLSWQPALLSVFVVGNALAMLAYYAIAWMLWSFVSRRQDLIFTWMFRLFAAFIFSCGTSHCLKIWTIWHADYWCEACVDLFTGVISVLTAVLLWKLIPVALNIRGPAQWEQANSQLQKAMEQQAAFHAALIESEERTRSYLQLASEAFVATDMDGRVVDWNAEAEKLFGWTKDEIVGQLLSESIVPPALHKTLQDRLARYRDAEDSSTLIAHLEVTLRSRSGKDVPVSYSSFPVVLNGKRIFCALVRDIDDRLKAQEALKLARDQALEVARFKSEFLANMSHEIRTPLNGILGMADVLGRMVKTDTERGYIAVIQDEGKALLSVINDILDFSKIEAGKMTFSAADFDVMELVESVIELFAEDARTKGLSLACFVEASVPAVLGGDVLRIRQVLNNLLSNAVKFSEKGGILLRVSLQSREKEHAQVRFSVIDQGVGLSRDEIDHLFKPFVQLDGSLTRAQGGTGLGLSICKRLVELMQGTIDVQSVKGEGATFSFSLPLLCSELVESRSHWSTGIDLHGLSALVISSSSLTGIVVRECLQAWGLLVDQAYDLNSAMQLAGRKARDGAVYDLAVVDASISFEQALDFAGRIEQLPELKGTRLILISACGEPEHKDVALKAGFAYCLIGPIRQSPLLDAMATIFSEPVAEESAGSGSGSGSGSGAGATGEIPELKPIGRNELILVVEDHKINQAVAILLLRDLGFECQIAANGKEALEQVKQIPYALIFMDCQMPEMDGFEATRQIRQLEKQGLIGHIPIIAMTAHVLEGSREQCLQCGMDDYLGKPFELNQLAGVLQRWLPVEEKSSTV